LLKLGRAEWKKFEKGGLGFKQQKGKKNYVVCVCGMKNKE
jgi:hypothetical protein